MVKGEAKEFGGRVVFEGMVVKDDVWGVLSVVEEAITCKGDGFAFVCGKGEAPFVGPGGNGGKVFVEEGLVDFEVGGGVPKSHVIRK